MQLNRIFDMLFHVEMEKERLMVAAKTLQIWVDLLKVRWQMIAAAPVSGRRNDGIHQEGHFQFARQQGQFFATGRQQEIET